MIEHTIAVLIFKNDPKQAENVLENLEQPCQDGELSIDSGIAIQRNPRGQAHVLSIKFWDRDSGPVWAQFWTLLVGLVFAGPMGGMFLNLGLRVAAAPSGGQDLSGELANQISAELDQQASALFLAIPRNETTTLDYVAALPASNIHYGNIILQAPSTQSATGL